MPNYHDPDYFKNVHERAAKIADEWYKNPKVRKDILKDLIMKELKLRGYWHFINEDKKQEPVAPATRIIEEGACLCSKIKKLFSKEK